MSQPSLDEMKETRKQMTNIFALLYQAKFEGSKSEAVFNALRFVDALVGKINKDIEALEPKADVPSPVKESESVVTPEVVSQ